MCIIRVHAVCFLPLHSPLCPVWCRVFAKAESGLQCLCVHIAYCLSTPRFCIFWSSKKLEWLSVFANCKISQNSHTFLPHLEVCPILHVQTGRPIYFQTSLFVLVNFPYHFPSSVLANSIAVSSLNAEWAVLPPLLVVSSFLRERWGLNLVPQTYAESILQTELSSQPFRVLYCISPKISLLINANCSLHLIIIIPDMIAHKNSTCSVAAMLLAFPLWFRVKTTAS